VTHRRYVSYAEAHYGGNLVDGAYVLALFGDVATELSMRTDGDEGLLAGYRDITFHAPVHAGDVIEVTGDPDRCRSPQQASGVSRRCRLSGGPIAVAVRQLTC